MDFKEIYNTKTITVKAYGFANRMLGFVINLSTNSCF